MGSVTGRDVALAAGVSQATVSRALRPDSPVAAGTRERVLAAADRLGYVPNSVAQGLATQRTGTIAVVVADLTNPFYPYLLRPLHDAFDLAGYRVTLISERTDVRSGREHLAHLLDRSLDGVLFTTATLDFDAAELRKRDVPFVLLIRSVDAVHVDTVTSDNLEGGRMAARLLLAGGHTRIGMVAGPDNTSTARDRNIGFRAVLHEAGLPLDDELLQGDLQLPERPPARDRAARAAGAPDRALLRQRRHRVRCARRRPAHGRRRAPRRLDPRVRRHPDGRLGGVRVDHDPTVVRGHGAHGRAAPHRPHRAARLDLPPQREVFPVSVVERSTVGPARGSG